MERSGKNIGQFRAVPIPSSAETVFRIIEIFAGEEMPEDQFGNVAFLRRVHVDGNTRSVVEDRDAEIGHRDLQGGHGLIPRIRIGGVDQNFIEYFQERGRHERLSFDHRIAFAEPDVGHGGRERPDVRIRSVQDVLALVEFFVSRRHRHLEINE